jgi:Family of unknown function (DUF5906)
MSPLAQYINQNWTVDPKTGNKQFDPKDARVWRFVSMISEWIDYIKDDDGLTHGVNENDIGGFPEIPAGFYDVDADLSGKAVPWPVGHESLIDSPEAGVIIVGADDDLPAAETVFPDYAVIAIKGAAAVREVNLSLLSGRSISVWASNSERGANFVKTIVRRLSSTTTSVNIVDSQSLAELSPYGELIANPGDKSPKDFIREWTDVAALRAAVLRLVSPDVPDERGRAGNEEDLIARLHDLNETHCYVSEEGVSTVISFRYNKDRGRHHITRQKTHDFEKDFMDQQYQIPSRKTVKTVRLGSHWLQWPLRKKYLGGVIFDPSPRAPKDYGPGRDVLNLWKGFGVKAIKGDCSKFLLHLMTVVCNGDEECFNYLVNWMAKAVQHPELQGEVAVVLYGKKGTGKSIFGRAFNRLFGSHSMIIQNAKHLTGNFNEHLQCTVALFVEEAPFAGDHTCQSVLKSLVTDATFVSEAKYKKAVEADNHLHIIMASNESHVVYASDDERRYFALKVSDEKIGDFDYFGAIQNELDNGGYEALLYHLQNVDLKDFNVRKIPQTEGLYEQKLESLPLEQKWLCEVLTRSFFVESKIGNMELQKWHSKISANLVKKSLEDYAKIRGKLAYAKNGVQLVDMMKQCGFTHGREREIGSVCMGEAMVAGTPETQWNETRASYYGGKLTEVREKFALMVGIPNMQWDPCEDEEDDPGRLDHQVEIVLKNLEEAVRLSDGEPALERNGERSLKDALEEARRLVGQARLYHLGSGRGSYASRAAFREALPGVLGLTGSGEDESE